MEETPNFDVLTCSLGSDSGQEQLNEIEQKSQASLVAILVSLRIEKVDDGAADGTPLRMRLRQLDHVGWRRGGQIGLFEGVAVKMEDIDKSCTKSKKPMVWSDSHNEVLVQEMYLFEPWKYKRGSKQRGQVWERISESLNEHDTPKFAVNQKSVRDHYILLEKEHKKKIREEEKASGIAPQHKPFDDSMRDIIELFKERDNVDQQQDAEKKERADEETAKAVDMRKSSMETFAQSKKRRGEQSEQKKVKRATGTETVTYLREKAEIDAELKREELQLKKAELEEKKTQQESFLAQQENLTRMLCDSMKSQQKQQEQLLQQMQLQNTALITLLQGSVLKPKDV